MAIEVKQIQWFDDHYYEIDLGNGNLEYFPSVTTKLNASPKPFLGRWRGDIGNREADMRMTEAADRGSRIHHAWYTLNSGGIVIYNPLTRPTYTLRQLEELTQDNKYCILQRQDEMWDAIKLQKWVEIVQPEFLYSEQIVYSLTRREAGMMDNLVRIKKGKYPVAGSKPIEIPEGIYILDLKTGKTVDDDAYLQTSAYAHFCLEMKLAKAPIGTIIVHTGATTKTGIEGLTTHVRSFDEMRRDFEDYTYVAKIWERKINTAPKVFTFPSLIKLSTNA